jgi:hypothetical protein
MFGISSRHGVYDIKRHNSDVLQMLLQCTEQMNVFLLSFRKLTLDTEKLDRTRSVVRSLSLSLPLAFIIVSPMY